MGTKKEKKRTKSSKSMKSTTKTKFDAKGSPILDINLLN